MLLLSPHLGPLTLDFQAAIDIPLAADWKPAMTLAGIGISGRGGGMNPSLAVDTGWSVGGALLFNPQEAAKGRQQFDGIIQVTLPFLTANVAGSYGKLDDNGEFSLFVFCELGLAGRFMDGGIGPPSFRLKRLMGGGGHHSEVRLPGINELEKFPLLRGLDDMFVMGVANPSPLRVLGVLCDSSDKKEPWVKPRAGNSWAAFGAEFEVFGFIGLNLMGLVEWGSGYSVSVLGVGEARFPKTERDPDKLTAFVALQVTGQFLRREVEVGKSGGAAPATRMESVWTLAGVLWDWSFVFDQNSFISGGFAFMTWREGEHEGDWVFTVGGYSPDYTAPPHYPNVPRVGITTSYKHMFTVQGELYFAFNSKALMLGGSVSLTADLAKLRWWISVRLDMWISWSPWRGGFSAGVSVGLEAAVDVGPVHLRPRMEVGVDLAMWFSDDGWGGDWSVHVWFVSFSGRFGVERLGDHMTVGWETFQRQIPNPVKPRPRAGMEPPDAPDVQITHLSHIGPPFAAEPGDAADPEKASEPWLVAQSGFTFTTSCVVPATSVTVNGSPVELGEPSGGQGEQSSPGLDIRPMGLKGVQAVHHLTVCHLPKGEQVDVASWGFKPVRSNVPASLWGNPDKKTAELDGDLVRGHVTGLEVTVPPPKGHCAAHTDGTPLLVDADALETECVDAADQHPFGDLPLTAKATRRGSATTRSKDGSTIGLIAQQIASKATSAARTQLFQALVGAGLSPGHDDPLTAYAGSAQITLTDDPLLAQHV
ncbi:DUF6603 domain-containing protein [Streptomyces sp. NPDC059788]|uniref:DUF6603 domain-containing protein n=1 Tax=Streptomyces sp. NPDC059788 TaxID=3346948 RepID=UPI0036511269